MPEIQMVPVHYANRSGRGKAAYFLPYETAREMVDARLAIWEPKKARYINLTKSEPQMHKPAPSLKPNIRTMDAYVEGKMHAVAIIDAWRGRAA